MKSKMKAAFILRLVLSIAGGAAVAWSITVMPVFRSEQALFLVAARIIAGEAYKPETISGLLATANVTAPRHPFVLSKIAVLQLRQVEHGMISSDRDRQNSEFEILRRSIEASLANTPTDAFLWLALFWQEHIRIGFSANNLRYLQMSYSLGPNEGWIAAIRNRLVWPLFPMLPVEMAENAIEELVGLARSRAFVLVADIVSGPGWPVRHILMGRLNVLPDRDRVAMSKLLEERRIDGASEALGVKSQNSEHR